MNVTTRAQQASATTTTTTATQSATSSATTARASMSASALMKDGSEAAIERFGPATKKYVHGLHVLSLKGSFYEMARQHGHLLKDEIPLGPLPYYRTFIEKLFGGSRFGRVGVVAFNLLQRQVGKRVREKMPDFVEETVRGLADGAGIPFDQMMEGATMPDSMVWLAARMMQMRGPGPAMSHRVALGLGCTSAVAWGNATKDGRLLHARNFDYHGVAAWPRTQSVLFYEPDDGQKYVSVGAAGVGLGGVTAMNEAGLSLTVHQHMFTDKARLGGTPIGAMGDVVMRKAETLDDAVRILKEQKPISCWTYVITDGKRREVLCHEENPDRNVHFRYRQKEGAGAKKEDSTFGYANIYLDRELGDTELDLYPSYWRHNRARYERATKLLRERAGQLDPESMGNILADVGDGHCRIRGSIAMVLTVGSVVFRPEDGVVWVGNGQAPTSHNTFVPFSLRKQDHAPEEGMFTAKDDLTKAAREAFDNFRQAYIAYVDESDLAKARILIERACDLEPKQSIYHALAGLLALCADKESSDPTLALTHLNRAITLGHEDEERVATFHLWRARALDILGRRPEAKRDYLRVLGLRHDRAIAVAAHKGLSRTYTKSKAARIHIDMSLADVVNP